MRNIWSKAPRWLHRFLRIFESRGIKLRFCVNPGAALIPEKLLESFLRFFARRIVSPSHFPPGNGRLSFVHIGAHLIPRPEPQDLYKVSRSLNQQVSDLHPVEVISKRSEIIQLPKYYPVLFMILKE